MARLDGKTTLISGGARGIGAAHARRFIAEGASVVIGDVLDAEGKALANELGDRAQYVHLDVTRPEEWTAAVQLASASGKLDVLVNNAGIANGGMLADYSLQDWNSIIAINLTGSFLGMQIAVPAMGRGSSIINTSSVLGLRGQAGLHGYVASKFGVRGLTKSVAMEVAGLGIRVNSVHPGFVTTAMTDGSDPEDSNIPLGIPASPEQITSMVLYLASDESVHSTGAEFVVDGGMTASLP
ncbi:SDR family oxidoreductase [Prescottella sp. R16]|uniref:SDR family oxidoreductase n=1 Tax=Prescottella sp. R16 TaxID=3064529 RepID=UPI00272EAAA3|nr:SDR family oxidoreductase [Prescottella sp. R16]